MSEESNNQEELKNDETLQSQELNQETPAPQGYTAVVLLPVGDGLNVVFNGDIKKVIDHYNSLGANYQPTIEFGIADSGNPLLILDGIMGFPLPEHLHPHVTENPKLYLWFTHFAKGIVGEFLTELELEKDKLIEALEVIALEKRAKQITKM